MNVRVSTERPTECVRQQSSWADLNRTVLTSLDIGSSGVEVAIVEEDLGIRPVWTFKPSYHSVFVRLEDRVAPGNEAQFDGGSSARTRPPVGGVWIVPAEQRFDIVPRGHLRRFCEIRIPAKSPDCEQIEISPQINIYDGLLSEAARVFQKQAENDRVSRTSARHLAEAMHWHIIDRYDVNPARRSPDTKILPRNTKEYIISYINEMIGTRIMLEDLAKISSLDVHLLLKRFYGSFGTTPAQYIIGVRIERAKLLLTSSSLPVSEIAAVAGFHSPSHFCVSFMKHVGIAPLAFRLSHR